MIHLDLHDWQENYAQVKIIHQIMQEQDALLDYVGSKRVREKMDV